MFKITLPLILFFCLIGQQTTLSQTVKLTVTTLTEGGTYSPNHVFAVWVEDATGNFVKSCKVMASKRAQYLYTWNVKSKSSTVDAVTGATLPSHQTHSIIWNCKGASGTVVPNGNYKMWIEYTDKHAQGPIYSIDFTISGASQHVTPIDQAYFKNMSLDFTPVTTDISSSLMDRKLTILPNPSHGLVFINFSPETSSPVKLNVMDISGHLLLSKTIASAKLNNYELDLTKLGKGIYTIKIDTKTSTVSQKLVVN